ncbi:ABC transporter B family member 26, chloroplastic isoform X2 [Cannabis sativa]|uniref:ABC transporter B family member 26, chloroplastic isoform X2 n=1 Tax=Cannabis sativa TaxID=3483 RepID=UPI0029CA0B04|nr:ABC transporter B family member 26, chloroplastic isoform X2 [Cannabis sativa]
MAILHHSNISFSLTTTTTLSLTKKHQCPFQTIHSNLSSFRFPIHTSPYLRPFRSSKKHGAETIVRRHWARFFGSVTPLESWWRLHDDQEEEEKPQLPSAEEPVTVSFAIRRMWELIGDDRWIVFVGCGALIGAAVSEISMPGILTAAIFSAQRGDSMVFYRNSQLLVLLCLISGVCSGIRSGCFAVVNTILIRRLRETLYSVIIFQDISFFDREAIGDLTSRLGADCQRLSSVIGNDINLILRNLLQGTGALVNLLMLSWPLALSAIVICSVLSTIFHHYSWYQKRAAKLTQDFTAGANEVARETLSLIRTVRIHETEEKEEGRFNHWLDKIAFITIRESVAYGLWNLSFFTLYRSTQVFAVLLGGMSILSGHVTLEHLTKYVLYCEWLIYATWRVTDNVSTLVQSVGASEEVFQLMNLVPCNQFLSKGEKLQKIMGHIQFVNVSFCYSSRMKVGANGSGKSTIINLLLRLYEPISGQIYIDGIPLKELDIRWLRGKVGMVEQEPHLFHMDVKSNIKYGCSREIKQEDIEWAAKQAYAHDFISSFPDGYETLVDDKLLSGGQKQRIAIARAILRDPAILILDEATSALDSESEHYVKGVIHAFRNNLNSKRTVIVIAHRFSTIKAADRIIVMDSGRVIEMGNHFELMLKDEFYANLVRAQTEVCWLDSS